MKQKLALLLLALVITIGAWADVVVTLNDQTDLSGITNASTSEATATHKYGTYSGSVSENTPPYTTFTTNTASGLAGVTFSTTAKILKPTYVQSSSSNYQHVIAVYPSDTESYSFTISAPTGYYIKSYTLKAISTGSAGTFDITPAGCTKTNVSSTLQTISYTPYNSTATLTIKRVESSDKVLCIPQFSVTLAKDNGTYTSLVISKSAGTLSRTDGTSSDYNDTWTSSSNSGFKLTCSRNNMDVLTDYLDLHANNGATYTISAPSGYLIAGYTLALYGSSDDNKITPLGGADISINNNVNNPTYVCVNNVYTNTTTFTRTGGNKAAYATSFVVYLVPSSDCLNINYTVVDGSGNSLATKEGVKEVTGSVPSLPSSIQNSFCDYGGYYSNTACTGDAVTIITEATTLYTKMSVNDACPVRFSTIETPTWYYLNLRDIYPSAASSDATYPIPSESPVASSGGAWAFIGNPYKFYLYNKLTTKYLEKNNSVNSGAENGTQFSSSPFEWQMNAHDAGSGSFRIYTYATASYAKPYHIFSNNVKIMWLDIWDGKGDGEVGGKFVVSEYSDDFTSQVTSNIKPFFDKYAAVGEVYFGISTATYNSYNSAYTSALSICTEDDYNDLYENVVTNGLKLPEDGYYRLKNVANGTNYLAYSGDLTVSTSTSSTSVLYIDVQNDGTMSIALQGSNYIQMPTGSTVLATLSSTPMMYTATVRSPGEVSLVGPNPANGFQFFGVSGSTIVGQSGTSTSAQWIFEKATSFSGAITNAKDNTDTERSFATLCVPFAISALTGASAYMPTVSGDYVVLGDAATVSEGTLIPAGTPVILVGAKDAGTYTATIKSGTAPATSPAETNVLTGTFAGTSIDTRDNTGEGTGSGTNYVLGFDIENDNRIGFYHVNNASYALKANRAYLDTSVSGSVKGFAISFGETDGIKAIDNGQWKMDNDEIFNLAGQRISKLQRGVNIVKGKKVVVK